MKKVIAMLVTSLVMSSMVVAFRYRASIAAFAHRVSPAAARAASPPSPAAPTPPKTRAKTKADPTYVGVLLPPQMANVSSRVDGRLLELPVRVGQAVHKGDVLASFDARERQQELAMAEAQFKAARGTAAAAGADLGAARARASRRGATVEVGGRQVPLVSGEEAAAALFDAHGAAGRAAAAAGVVAEQKARIASLRIALEESTLRAPFDGVVTALYAEPGMTIHGGETVVRLVGGGVGLRVRLAVPEEETGVAKIGNVAHVRLEGDRVLVVPLARVSPEIDPVSRTFQVEGDLDLRGENHSTIELAGRTVRATITPP